MALELIAFLGYGGFLLVTFGWRTVQARRSSTRPSWRKPISRADTLGETACLLACFLSLAAPPLAVAGPGRPVAIGWAPARGLLSVAGTVLGTALALAAQHHLGRNWRAGVEASDELVTTGPFARVRNPFYLGCFLVSGAVLVAVPSAVAAAGFVLHLAAAQVIVRAVEEPVLLQAHGAAFGRYAAHTGRFLPRLWR